MKVWFWCDNYSSGSVGTLIFGKFIFLKWKLDSDVTLKSGGSVGTFISRKFIFLKWKFDSDVTLIVVGQWELLFLESVFSQNESLILIWH